MENVNTSLKMSDNNLKQNNFNIGLEELESGKGYKEKLIKSFEKLDLEKKIDTTRY